MNKNRKGKLDEERRKAMALQKEEDERRAVRGLRVLTAINETLRFSF